MGLDVHYGIALKEGTEAEALAKLEALRKETRKMAKGTGFVVDKIHRYTGPEAAMGRVVMDPFCMDIARRKVPELAFGFVIFKPMPEGDYIPIPLGIALYPGRKDWKYASYCSTWGPLTDFLGQVVKKATEMGFVGFFADESQPENDIGNFEQVVPADGGA